MPRLVRVLFLAILIALLALSGLALTSPDSAAQTDTDPTKPVATSLYAQLPVGSLCPADTSFAGEVSGSAPDNEGMSGTYCRPDGFVPIVDQETCDLLGALALWVDDGSLAPICAVNGFDATQVVRCPAPTVLGEGTAPSGNFRFWCLLQPLVEGSFADNSFGLPICIEDPLVAQAAPVGAAVGSTFFSDREYLIHAGPPTCETNCHDGFDFNCDGELGDFCAVELDLTTVVGVHDCIESFAPADPEEAVATIDAAPAAPQAIPVATSSGPALAQTGSESGLLTYLGLGLVGFGATALGIRRRQH